MIDAIRDRLPMIAGSEASGDGSVTVGERR
jgi:hypothetical protein